MFVSCLKLLFLYQWLTKKIYYELFNVIYRYVFGGSGFSGTALSHTYLRVVMGVTLSGSYYFCVWMQWWAIVAYVPVFVPMIFVVYALVKAQKYDHNRKNNNQKQRGT